MGGLIKKLGRGAFAGICLLLVLFVLRTDTIFAAHAVSVAVFVRDGCPHCEKEETFLTNLAAEDTGIALTIYRLENEEGRTVWGQVTEANHIPKVTPITVIGHEYLVGYDSDGTTGTEIRQRIAAAAESGVETDIRAPLTPVGTVREHTSTCPDDGSKPCVVQQEENSLTVSLPVVGPVDIQKYPLVALSAILGFVDGFNPCAMWVLITFLVILLQVGDRRKMIVFASVFIFAEAVMYGVILSLWYQAWNFVKLDAIVTPIVGCIAIIGGVFFIREWRKKELECKVTNPKERQRTYQRIRSLAAKKLTLMTVAGVLALAFSVNIIEFACSIGIPQTFTKIIDINHVSRLHSFFLLILYIFFYMLDDLVVFALAIYSADRMYLSKKYSKWSNLVGGIIMIALGILLLANPQALRF